MLARLIKRLINLIRIRCLITHHIPKHGQQNKSALVRGHIICARLLSDFMQVRAHLGATQTQVVNELQLDTNP